VFSDRLRRPTTVSVDGGMDSEKVQLIMKKIMDKYKNSSSVLIQGVKGKFDSLNNLIDEEPIMKLKGVNLISDAVAPIINLAKLAANVKPDSKL
jgi:hypothetical protein